MLLTEAQEIANEVIKKLENHLIKYEICGSIRRKREAVNDIDIVAIPKPEESYSFGELSLYDEIIKLDPEGSITKQRPDRFLNGKAIKRFIFKNALIDLYLANENTFECLKLIRTGSTEHNIRLTTLAIGKGLRLFASGAGLCTFKMVNDKAVPVDIVENTEEAILEYLLGRIPLPEERN